MITDNEQDYRVWMQDRYLAKRPPCIIGVEGKGYWLSIFPDGKMYMGMKAPRSNRFLVHYWMTRGQRKIIANPRMMGVMTSIMA